MNMKLKITKCFILLLSMLYLILLFSDWSVGGIQISAQPIFPKEQEAFIETFFGFGALSLSAIIYGIDMRLYNQHLFKHYQKQNRLANEYKFLVKNFQNQEICNRAKDIQIDTHYKKESLYNIRLSDSFKRLQNAANANKKGNKEDFLDLEAEINSYFPNFTQLLCYSYPKITEKKLNLCLLIKAGFQTKDIASLLCMHHSSISHLKMRIFKELNITETNISNLNEYLYSL